jgi:deazaflavin-dependent oxidoreductase (nitroreductase family)
MYMTDLTRYAKKSTVRLTTVGRKSGKPRAVTIWFVVADGRRIYVQHAGGEEANWYRNLVKNPEVQVDFGDGPVRARATPIHDRQQVRRVLAQIRRKHLFAFVFQLLALTKSAVAAEIEVELGS